MEVGGRKELEPVYCQNQMLMKQRPEAPRRGFADQGHTGNAWEQGNWRGFLSIGPVSLRLEDPCHAGLGREAVWQGRFLVAGHVCVTAVCWLASRGLWMHLVMQQVCFLVWDPVCFSADPGAASSCI